MAERHSQRELQREDLRGALASEEVKVSSPAFEEGGEIPSRFTCEGEDHSPPLSFSAPPPGTQSLALVMDDPDAPDPKRPVRRFVHWVLYNLPPTTRELPEAVTPDQLPPGACEGRNDFGRTRYGGPCPPIGRHRYFFAVYALDCQLDPDARYTRDELLAAARGHVLAQGELVGTYQLKETRS